MEAPLSNTQEIRIREGKNLIKYTSSPDCLFRLVAMVGPSLVGLIVSCNSDTIWSRVENPSSFRYFEIKRLAEAFEVPIAKLVALIEMQSEHNDSELLKRRPIGREKYNPKKYGASEKHRAPDTTNANQSNKNAKRPSEDHSKNS